MIFAKQREAHSPDSYSPHCYTGIFDQSGSLHFGHSLYLQMFFSLVVGYGQWDLKCIDPVNLVTL